jgi:hypothetical protein
VCGIIGITYVFNRVTWFLNLRNWKVPFKELEGGKLSVLGQDDSHAQYPSGPFFNFWCLFDLPISLDAWSFFLNCLDIPLIYIFV